MCKSFHLEKLLNYLSPAKAMFLAELCNPITRQAIELFKPPTDSASLVVEIEKKIFVFGGGFSGGTPQVGMFLATFTWPLAPTHWTIIMAQDFFGN